MGISLFFKSLLALLVFFAVEIYIWTAYFKGVYGIETVMILHSIVTLLIISCVGLFKWLGFGIRFITITALLTGTMGPFGAGLSILILILYFIYYALVDKVGELLRVLMPRIHIPKSQELYERIVYGLDSYDLENSPIPMHDIMEFGSTEQKLEAIGVILKYYRPEFIPTLQQGLVDKSNAVRVLAATAISSIEKTMHDKYVSLKKKYEKNPNNSYVILELAKLAREESHASFFDPAHQRKMQFQAIEFYQEYLQLEPKDTEVRFQLAHLLFETKQFKEAKVLVQSLIDEKAEFTAESYTLLMEILFSEKEYSKMHALTVGYYSHLKKLAENESDLAFGEAIDTWGGQFLEEVHA